MNYEMQIVINGKTIYDWKFKFCEKSKKKSNKQLTILIINLKYSLSYRDCTDRYLNSKKKKNKHLTC